MKTCEGCKKLREELVEALRTVDTDDWNTLDGTTPRKLETVLRDVAERLERLGEVHDE